VSRGSEETIVVQNFISSNREREPEASKQFMQVAPLWLGPAFRLYVSATFDSFERWSECVVSPGSLV
jgi:hypothetical protein